jgi:hypothetical protein
MWVSSGPGATQVETGLEDELEQEAAVETRMSHLDAFRPTCWLPPEIMPMSQARSREWADGFHNLVYALAGLLHDDCITCPPDDWAKARLLYMLAEEVRSPFQSFQLVLWMLRLRFW